MSLVTSISEKQINEMHQLYSEKSSDCADERLFRLMVFRALNYYLSVIALLLFRISERRPNNGRKG
jgi:hypothetical protein